jgi:hypothetical protein
MSRATWNTSRSGSPWPAPKSKNKDYLNDVTYRTDRKCVRPSVPDLNADGLNGGSTLHNPSRLHSAKIPEVHNFSISPRTAAPENYFCLDVPKFDAASCCGQCRWPISFRKPQRYPLAFLYGKAQDGMLSREMCFPRQITVYLHFHKAGRICWPTKLPIPSVAAPSYPIELRVSNGNGQQPLGNSFLGFIRRNT